MAAEMDEVDYKRVLGYPAIYKRAYRPAKLPILIQKRSAAWHPGPFPQIDAANAANAANAMHRTNADSVTIE